MEKIYPLLNQSFKKRFPFRLSVPSFIYPADYATNVRRLGSYVDEIELLFFESDNRSLPSAAQIRELVDLAAQRLITYNIHLPIDLDLVSGNRSSIKYAVEKLSLLIDRVAPLSPTTHTLHLQCDVANTNPEGIEAWQTRTIRSLEDLLRRATIPSRSISIETLDYPPAWFAPIIEELDLAVCVDVGHVLRYGFDLQETLSMFGRRIEIFHLHGVADGKDHLCLDKLDPMAQQTMQRHLSHFKGSVSLEMFSFERLRDSLPCLVKMMATTDSER